jgi:hypothetical protein
VAQAACSVGITDGENLLSTPLRWPQVAGYTYQLSRILVEPFKQYYVRFCLRNYRGCNVGITDVKDL